ncbi:TetR/AcrR family transcriptional regulator [Streptomyces sp. NBC_00006]|uniref:TetR/AcrR family transcriptional regulator n=1 Tax=unclassified Streptomyces TaxID=2593676 RepID=UPI00225C4202|nr:MULTISPECIES: TetR/AcrR family transcriptional regulator [unclassified Streptomyces]MCX4834943.1 TetR/AcrR family transcriptional regulator [Streptomyces sp. NBC_01016]MCX5529182.1 TetR/AcrR family transcriptional regulator [Streptomyces sp. NBC_00006]
MASADRRLTPRRKPRQVRAELTRERILNSAAHVFAEYGYAAGTTNRIAEHAHMSIGSLYQYFPNKDAILAELLVRHIDRGAWTGADRIELTPGSLRDLVRSLVRDAIDHHREDPQLLRIMIEQAPVSSELIEAVDQHGATRVAQLRDLLARHPDVHVQDLDMAAELILGTVELNTHKLMATPHAVQVERLEKELVDMITLYLQAGR